MSELERLIARRRLLSERLARIADGAQIHYDDGTPVDMASERARLEDEAANLDRKLLALRPPSGQA